VPVIDFLAQTAQRKWARHFYRFLLVGVLFRAISTYSRGGFLACIALGAGYLFRSQQKFRVLIAMGVLLVVVLPALPDSFWDRMRTIQTYTEEESALSRLHFWKVAAEMANANPLLGVGFNAYNEAYDTYDFSHGRYGKGRSVHSSYYSIVAELGYTGLLLYGLIVFGAIRGCNRVHRLAKRGSIPAELGKSAFALEMSLFVFLCGGSFVIFQYNEMLWHFFGLTIVLEHLAARSAEKQSSDVSPEPSLSYALASQE
jgi:putative inorganic carbon (HCO3(-)) transporter